MGSLTCRRLCRGCSSWRAWLTVVMVMIYIVYTVIWTSALSYEFYHGTACTGPFCGWFVSSFVVMWTVGLFMISLRLHWINYTKPHEQRYVIFIATFLPWSTYFCWWSLKYPNAYIYFKMIREVYVSFMMYCYFAYLSNYLKTTYYPLDDVMSKRPVVKHAPCCRICCPAVPSKYLVRIVRCCVLQLCIFQPILSLIGIITEVTGYYKQGQLVPDGFYLYDIIFSIIFRIICVYGLVLLTRGTTDLLVPLSKPWRKLIFIKVVLLLIPSFFPFILGILARFNVLPSDQYLWMDLGLGNNPVAAISDFTNIILTFFFSLWFLRLFSHRPYINPSVATIPLYTDCIRLCQTSNHHEQNPLIDNDIQTGDQDI